MKRNDNNPTAKQTLELTKAAETINKNCKIWKLIFKCQLKTLPR